MSPNQEKRTEAIQWTIYLFLGTLLGVFWTPLALFLRVDPDNFRSQPMVRHTLVWVLLTGFVYAFLFRALADRESRAKPSNWYAASFPLVAAITFSLVSYTIGPRFSPDRSLVGEIFRNVAQAYICSGLVLIPLAAFHVRLLRGLDRQIADWAPGANSRTLRRAALGMVTASLVFATELPRFFERNRQTTLALASAELETPLPAQAEVLYQSYKLWRHKGIATVWIRTATDDAWPPKVVEATLVATRQGTPSTPYLAVPFDRVTDKLKIGWRGEEYVYTATLFRTPDSDYICYQASRDEESQ